MTWARTRSVRARSRSAGPRAARRWASGASCVVPPLAAVVVRRLGGPARVRRTGGRPSPAGAQGGCVEAGDGEDGLAGGGGRVEEVHRLLGGEGLGGRMRAVRRRSVSSRPPEIVLASAHRPQARESPGRWWARRWAARASRKVLAAA